MERFEAVVVGAGPAGLSAAYELARHGTQVLVLERGRFPGSKNVTGGILYGQSNSPFNLDYLFPDFAQRAPIERSINQYLMHNISGDKVKTLDITPLHRHKTKYAYSVLRIPFDRWFGEEVHKEARKHGGGILSNVRVAGPLIENGQIAGVVSDELDPIRADLVIAADGATSDLVRGAGLGAWGPEDHWFQGVKVVAKMPRDAIDRQFQLQGDEGSAHLFAGDLFGGCRGGGFLYTNRETLSIGTVFHLDSLSEKATEPHKYLDRLLSHPLLVNLLGGQYEELEYSAKLIPDGKKSALKVPYKGRLLAVGDAAGQMKAAGPIIKGMNLGVTAGILAAQAYLVAKRQGRLGHVGPLYASFLASSYVGKELFGGRVLRWLASRRIANRPLERLIEKPESRFVHSRFGQASIRWALGNYRLASIAPDNEFVYVGLPTAVAREIGEPVAATSPPPKLRAIDERIAALTYDTDIGKDHIVVTDPSIAASGRAVTTCPVSSPESSRGCYRIEKATDGSGQEQTRVVLDTQPCVECGTCAIVAATRWNTPRGGKGVHYQWG